MTRYFQDGSGQCRSPGQTSTHSDLGWRLSKRHVVRMFCGLDIFLTGELGPPACPECVVTTTTNRHALHLKSRASSLGVGICRKAHLDDSVQISTKARGEKVKNRMESNEDLLSKVAETIVRPLQGDRENRSSRHGSRHGKVLERASPWTRGPPPPPWGTKGAGPRRRG